MSNPHIYENISPDVSDLLDCFDNLSKSDQGVFMNELFSKHGLPIVVIGGVASGNEAQQINIVISDLQDIPEVIDSIAEVLTSTLKKKQARDKSSDEESESSGT